MVPLALVALASDTHLDAFLSPEQVESYVAQDGEVLGSVVLARTVKVFSKGYVQHPVQPVLYAPVPSGRLREFSHIREAAQELALSFALISSICPAEAAVHTSSCTHRRKHSPYCCGSNLANTLLKVSCEGMPLGRGRNCSKSSRLERPNYSISDQSSAPQITAHMAIVTMSSSWCSLVRVPRLHAFHFVDHFAHQSSGPGRYLRPLLRHLVVQTLALRLSPLGWV
jgi:hypothetical protein